MTTSTPYTHTVGDLWAALDVAGKLYREAAARSAEAHNELLIADARTTEAHRRLGELLERHAAYLRTGKLDTGAKA